MHRYSIIAVCSIIIIILLAGCAPAQAIIIDLNEPRPIPASASSADTNATPDPSATSDRSAYVDEKEAQKVYEPTVTFATIDNKDFTTAENGATVIFKGEFSITLPAGSRYYYFKDNTDTPAFLVKYRDTDISIMKTELKPAEVLGMDEPFLPDMQKGTAVYNGLVFAYLGYTSGKDQYRYDYYFPANATYFCIGFSTTAGKDMGKDIKTILNSIKMTEP